MSELVGERQAGHEDALRATFPIQESHPGTSTRFFYEKQAAVA